MGVLTRAQLVSYGLNRAGDSSLTTLANQWLNDWLRATYAKWPWPFLQAELLGLALATGVQTLSVGNGAGGVTERVLKVFDPLYLYNSGYTVSEVVRVRPARGGPALSNPNVNSPTTNRGIPTHVTVRADASVEGRWVLTPWPVADKDYLLQVSYWKLPAHLSADTDVPPYPDDDTTIQAVAVAALQHMAGTDPDLLPRYQLEETKLLNRVRDNQASFGVVPGWLDTLELDDSVFR